MFVWTITDVIGYGAMAIIVVVMFLSWLWDKFKRAMNRMFGEGK